MISRILRRARSVERAVEVQAGRRRLHASGFEVVAALDGRGKGREKPSGEILSHMIQALRSRMSRSSQIYIVTRVAKHVGGTVVICVDAGGEAPRLCDLAASTLETISGRRFRARELGREEILSSLLVHSKYLGEVPDLNSFFSEEISSSEEVPSPSIPRLGDGILLGEVARSRSRQKIYLPLEILVRHVAVFGSTGSGKSTTSAALAVRARAKGYAVSILDWHGEYEDLLGGRQGLEVFRCGVSTAAHLLSSFVPRPLDLVEIFESVLDLTPAQSYVLSSAMRDLESQGRGGFFRSLARAVERVREDARWVSETKLSLARKIQELVDAEDDGQVLGMEDLEKLRFAVFDLSGIERTHSRELVSISIVKAVEMISRRGRGSARRLLVVDEAHHVFRRSEGGRVIRDTLSESRKWGLGVIIVSQSPSSLGEDSLKNTNTKIIHSIRSEADRRILRESMAVSGDVEQIMLELDVGEALVSAPVFRTAVPVKIYPPSVEG